jgi:hypothetical protein
MVRPLGTQPDTRTVIEPQPLAFGLFGWNFQPFAPPDPFYPLIIDLPAGTPQKLRNPPIAVSAVLASKINDVGRQPFFVITATRHFALRRTMLPEHTANPALGHIQRLPDMFDTHPAARRAQ